jgi:hypothetical protein
MSKERLTALANFLGEYEFDEKGVRIEGSYAHKLTHRNWNFACNRLGDIETSEIGELPTVFPDAWERKGIGSVLYKSNPDFEFWEAIRDFFDITQEDEDILFMWMDGNKKKCKKAGRLHMGATRREVANQIARFVGIEEF